MGPGQTLTAASIEAYDRIQRQIAHLTGAPFRFDPQPSTPTTIRQLWRELGGSQVLSRLAVHGHVNGEAVVLVGKKDAIRLGSTMVMLPKTDIEHAVEREAFDEDIAHAFGELVNIIAAQMARSLAGVIGGACRFTRTGDVVVAPDEFDSLGDRHLPDRQFQLLAAGLTHGDEPLGRVCVLAPSHILASAPPSKGGESAGETAIDPPAADRPAPRVSPADSRGAEAAATAAVTVRLEPLFDRAADRLVVELETLLGETVQCSCGRTGAIDRDAPADFIGMADPVTYSSRVRFESGDEAVTFLLDRSAAIRIGGILNLYDDERIEDAAAAGRFTADIQDGCTEVLRIVGATLCSSFASATREQPIFAGLQLDSAGSSPPSAVGSAADDNPVYFASLDMTLGHAGAVQLHLILPSAIDSLMATGAESGTADAAFSPGDEAAAVNGDRGGSDDRGEPGRVLVISENDTADATVTEALDTERIGWTRCACRDDIRAHITDDHRALILIFDVLDERAFATVIKASVCSSLPLVVAAGNWTESKVMAAVDYGVSDIIVLPAGARDVREKVRGLLRKNAA